MYENNKVVSRLTSQRKEEYVLKNDPLKNLRCALSVRELFLAPYHMVQFRLVKIVSIGPCSEDNPSGNFLYLSPLRKSVICDSSLQSYSTMLK